MTTCVSIILPSYNYARFLRERIRSIISQSFSDFELIIVDDASTDESLDIINEYAGRIRIKVIVHKINSGTVYQRWNEAASQATGDWLWFPNADDGAHPRFLERLLDLIHRYPTAGIAYSRPMFMDETGCITSVHSNWYSNAMTNLSGDYFSPGFKDLVFHTKGCYLTTASSLLIRRDAFATVGGFDTRLWGISDWDLYLKILHRYDFVYTAEPLAYYRSHGSNTTKTTNNVIMNLSNACCIARAYQNMKDDIRYSNEAKAIVLRRVKSRVFDLFAAGDVNIPKAMQFAADEIHQVVQDKRLLQ
jgi:glycosyltransferase involved in cell wall biosynthesis